MNTERVIKRLIRRSKKTAEAYFTPYPVSGPPPLLYLFACKGMITRLVVDLKDKPKSGARLIVGVKYDGNESISHYSFDKKRISQEVEIFTFSGARLKIDVEPIDKDEVLEDCMVGFKWEPHKSEVSTMKFLIDKLDELEDSYGKDSE